MMWGEQDEEGNLISELEFTRAALEAEGADPDPDDEDEP
jgi:hypothetical protein